MVFIDYGSQRFEGFLRLICFCAFVASFERWDNAVRTCLGCSTDLQPVCSHLPHLLITRDTVSRASRIVTAARNLMTHSNAHALAQDRDVSGIEQRHALNTHPTTNS